MDITEGAVLAIQKTAREAEKNKTHVSLMDAADPRKKYLLRGGEKPELVDVPPPYRAHAVYTLMDLTEYASKRIADHESAAQTAPPLVMWHNSEGVTLLLDDADRRDFVQLRLVGSAAWKLLTTMQQNGTHAYDQKRFIRLLKNEFGVSEGVVAQFRNLDFRTMIEGRSEVKSGRESLGKSVEAEVRAGGNDMPEEIFVSVPIYVNAGEDRPYMVRLLLDYDVQAQKVLVDVAADALEKRLQEHQADIDSRLRGALSDVPIYFGAP